MSNRFTKSGHGRKRVPTRETVNVGSAKGYYSVGSTLENPTAKFLLLTMTTRLARDARPWPPTTACDSRSCWEDWHTPSSEMRSQTPRPLYDVTSKEQKSNSLTPWHSLRARCLSRLMIFSGQELRILRSRNFAIRIDWRKRTTVGGRRQNARVHR
jgi:hypothetical protein